eukprot:TRINITY_DN557_c0_g1_i1.p1 TRINITY_DN557_c0_g1~~TRINITY_DN557_c0_g1_i1.p1  ORF type:complete len:433 (-),score=59.69 TRINITY_DN557_c0_g1_i1:1087-2385(-)
MHKLTLTGCVIFACVFSVAAAAFEVDVCNKSKTLPEVIRPLLEFMQKAKVPDCTSVAQSKLFAAVRNCENATVANALYADYKNKESFHVWLFLIALQTQFYPEKKLPEKCKIDQDIYTHAQVLERLPQIVQGCAKQPCGAWILSSLHTKNQSQWATFAGHILDFYKLRWDYVMHRLVEGSVVAVDAKELSAMIVPLTGAELPTVEGALKLAGAVESFPTETRIGVYVSVLRACDASKDMSCVTSVLKIVKEAKLLVKVLAFLPELAAKHNQLTNVRCSSYLPVLEDVSACYRIWMAANPATLREGRSDWNEAQKHLTKRVNALKKPQDAPVCLLASIEADVDNVTVDTILTERIFEGHRNIPWEIALRRLTGQQRPPPEPKGRDLAYGILAALSFIAIVAFFSVSACADKSKATPDEQDAPSEPRWTANSST